MCRTFLGGQLDLFSFLIYPDGTAKHSTASNMVLGMHVAKMTCPIFGLYIWFDDCYAWKTKSKGTGFYFWTWRGTERASTLRYGLRQYSWTLNCEAHLMIWNLDIRGRRDGD